MRIDRTPNNPTLFGVMLADLTAPGGRRLAAPHDWAMISPSSRKGSMKMSADANRSGANQFVLLDFLRFVCSILVLIFHYELFIINGDPEIKAMFTSFASGVDFFFILSGFVIAYSYSGKMGSLKDYMVFMQRRIARLYPLHVLTLFLAGSMAITASLIGFEVSSSERYHVKYFFGQLLMVHAWGFHDRLSFNIVSWSISVEFFAYLVFPVILAMIARLPAWAGCAASLCCIGLASVIAQAQGGASWHARSYDFGILRGVPLFFLGVVLWRLWLSLAQTVRVDWIWPTIGILICGTLLFSQNNTYALIAAFAMTILITALYESQHKLTDGRWKQVLKRLGDLSYGIYMYHLLIGIGIFTVATRHMEFLEGRYWITAPLSTVITLAVSLYSFKYIEDPLRNYFGRLGHKPRTSTQNT